MKKNWIMRGILFAIVSVALFAACKKDRTIIVIDNHSNPVYKLDANTFWTNYLPAKQTFTLDASAGGWISGANGCMIYIGANSLEDASGTAVTGNVDVELIEYMNKADMVFSGVTTVSGSELLESGGMFYLNVKKGGGDLKMKAGKTVQLVIPQANKTSDAMDFFKGVPNTGGDLNKVNWVLKDSIKAKPQKDSARGFYTMQFNYFQFGYCNLDRYYCQGKTYIHKFRIKMPKGCNDTNSTAMLLFKNYNACAWCHWMTTEDRITTNYSLPLGDDAKVLIYKKTGTGEDDIAYSIQDITFADDTEAVFGDAMTSCTKAQLAAIIKAL